MAQRPTLKVEKREVLGKEVKKLRRDGIIPGNVYGKDIKSQAVQLPMKEFQTVFDEVGGTGLVDLNLGSEVIPVLIHNVAINVKTSTPLHADFFKVNLKEKITAKIPVVSAGEPKAVADKVGLLEQPTMEIEVEALPTDLPENIEVNVENMAAVDDQISVADLKMPTGVEVLSEPSQVVFKIGELVTKEMEEQAAADEAEAAEAAAETEAEAAEGEEKKEGEEGAEGEAAEGGEAPAEGEAASEDKPAEEKPQE
jgi:large subunit ribosomal protein L25